MGVQKKRPRTIRNIKFIRGNLYALLLKDHLNKINIFPVNTFKIMGNTFPFFRLKAASITIFLSKGAR